MTFEQRPATLAELEAEYLTYPDRKLRDFIDQIEENDLIFFRRWDKLGSAMGGISGDTGSAYWCKKASGGEVWFKRLNNDNERRTSIITGDS